MSDKIDRKLQEIPVGEYRYRHEAEFAAGFLADAGIPYRLQTDDAGGAELGLSMMRPAILWVRATDARVARDLVGGDEPEAKAVTPVYSQRRAPDVVASRLTPLERAVSAGLGVALLSAVPFVPFGPYRSVLAGSALVGGFAFLMATAVGRGPGPLGRVIRMLSGSVPR